MSPPPPSISPPHPPRPRSLLSRSTRKTPLNLHQRSADFIPDTRLALLMMDRRNSDRRGGGHAHAVAVLLAPAVASISATARGVRGGHGGCVVSVPGGVMGAVWCARAVVMGATWARRRPNILSFWVVGWFWFVDGCG